MAETAINNNSQDLSLLAAELSIYREKQTHCELTPAEKKRVQEINDSLYDNDKFRNFLYGFLKERYPTIFTVFDENGTHVNNELVNEALIPVVANFHKYTGETDITTFSKPHIIHGAITYISKNKSYSRYQNEIDTKIKSVIDYLIKIGYHEDEINVELIQDTFGVLYDTSKKHNDISATQIQNALDKKNSSTSEELDPNFNSGNNKAFSPDKAYEEKESNERIQVILSSLLDYERFIIESRLGLFGDSMKYEEIGRNPEFLKLIEKAGYGNLIKVKEETRVKKDKTGNVIERKVVKYPCVSKDKIQELYTYIIIKLTEHPFFEEERLRIRNYNSKKFSSGESESFNHNDMLNNTENGIWLAWDAEDGNGDEN